MTLFFIILGILFIYLFSCKISLVLNETDEDWFCYIPVLNTIVLIIFLLFILIRLIIVYFWIIFGWFFRK
jgi:hypothetical protein